MEPMNTQYVPKGGKELGAPDAVMTVLLRGALQELQGELESLMQAKGALYQDAAGVDSCMKRGLAGLYHNLARKWDRIDAFAKAYGLSGESPEAQAKVAAEAQVDKAKPETLYVTVRDMTVYGLKTLLWMRAEEAYRLSQKPLAWEEPDNGDPQ